jgi:hypothetical protein
LARHVAAWQVVVVRIATWRRLGTASTIALLAACKAGTTAPPSAAEIADRGWRAHELVVAAGEHAATCAEAGAAMQRVFVTHRAAFIDAIALDHDRARLAEATTYLEAHQDRYADLETRMAALSERCADAPTVNAVFAQMESPSAQP